MKNIKRFAITLFCMLCVAGFVAPSVHASAASKYMTRVDFVKSVVKQLKGQKNVKGKKIKITLNKNGSVKVMGKTISAKTVKVYKSQYKVSLENAQYIAAAVKLGIIDADTFYSVKTKISYEDALVILAKADALLYKNSITQEDIDFVKENRLTGITKADDNKQDLVTKAYMLGYYAGKSDGNFTRTRTIKYLSNAKKSELTAMVKRLTVKKNRYSFSGDWQMLRISTKNRPKQEKYYAYILDDFTNAYYDMEFEFMQKTISLVSRNIPESLGGNKVDIDLATWDNVFKNQSYKKRLNWIFEYLESHSTATGGSFMSGEQILTKCCQYIYPSELWKFNEVFAKNQDKFGMAYASGELKEEEVDLLIERAEEFAYGCFNVDYRTIEDSSVCDIYDFSDEYIADAIKNETIIECDRVVADPSSIYYQVNYNEDRLQGYVVRVYVHYRVVSDNGTGDNSLVYNRYYKSAYWSLREVKESKDGLKFEWAGNDGEWRDGYFELGFAGGARADINSNFTLYRSRNNFTELLGGPKQRAYAEPDDGTYLGYIYHYCMINASTAKDKIDRCVAYYKNKFGKYVDFSN